MKIVRGGQNFTHTHTNTCRHRHTHTQTQTHTHTDKQTQTHTQTHTHTDTHTPAAYLISLLKKNKTKKEIQLYSAHRRLSSENISRDTTFKPGRAKLCLQHDRISLQVKC